MKLLQLFQSHRHASSELQKPYIIAEAGVNHEGSMGCAKRLIREAAESGADAIKFQTYKAETLTVKNSPAYWDMTKEKCRSQYKLFKKYDKFWINEFEKIKQYCDECNIEFLSTPFDVESAKFLNDLMDVFKISSSDITNKPFIEYICQFNKPVILSTGASLLDEIKEAVLWIGNHEVPLALMHCILNYPTNYKAANLGMIANLRREFPDKIIGYSDHTLPKDMKVLEIASLLGAAIIEKHFTFDKTLPGNDHYHSMDKEDLKLFIKNIDFIHKVIGHPNFTDRENERAARKYARRSIVAKTDILKGHMIKKEDLTWKRPGIGISPKFIDDLLNKTVKINIKKDSIIRWENLCE
jgi:N-acetylneuraminate synthase